MAQSSFTEKKKQRIEERLEEISETVKDIIDNIDILTNKAEETARGLLSEKESGRFLQKYTEISLHLEKIFDVLLQINCQLVEQVSDCKIMSNADTKSDQKNPSMILGRAGLASSVANGLKNSPQRSPGEFSFSSRDFSPLVSVQHDIPEQPLIGNILYPVKISSRGSPSNFSLVLRESSVVEFLQSLTETYKNASPLKMFPPESSYVVCKYEHVFCRAKFSTDCIVLIDTGDYVRPVLENIYALSPEFAHVPAQAFFCCLKGIAPTEGKRWSSKALIYFSELVENAKLLARFTKLPKETVKKIWDPRYCVDLYVDQRGTLLHVNAELVRLQYAVHDRSFSLGRMNPSAGEFRPSSSEPSEFQNGNLSSLAVQGGSNHSFVTLRQDLQDVSGRQSRLNPSASEFQPFSHSSQNVEATGLSIRCVNSVSSPASPAHIVTKAEKSLSKPEAVEPKDEILPRALPESVDDKPIEISITEIVSPSLFYAHVYDELTNKIHQIHDRLFTLFSARCAIYPPLEAVKVHSFWAAYWEEDGIWSRAEVTTLDGSKVGITFIDFGCSETVTAKDLRPLPAEFFHIPRLAVKCRLDCIRPASGPEWSPRSVSAFKALVGDLKSNAKIFEAAILSRDLENETVGLGLVDKSSEPSVFINQALVESGFATVVLPQGVAVANITTAQKQTGKEVVPLNMEAAGEEENLFTKWNPMEEEYESARNTLEHDSENLDSVTRGYVPRNETRVCPIYAKHGSCFKSETCSFLHMKVNPANFTTDKETVFFGLPDQEFPRKGSAVYVQVSCVRRTMTFSVIFPRGVRDIRLPKAAEADPENLRSLMDALQRHYDKDPFADRLTSVPALGEYLIARSAVDRKWCRAKIVSDTEEDNYAVHLVDFGVTENVAEQNLRKPQQEFMFLPPQAYDAILADCAGINGTWEANAVTEFRKLIDGKDLVAHVVDFEGSVLVLNLYDANNSIGDQLVNRGVAVHQKYRSHAGMNPA